MKNLIFLFSFIFSSFSFLVAQRSPVMPYGTHTQEDIISFLNRGSDTAKAFKKILLYRVNKLMGGEYKPLTYEAIPWILERVSSEEISFEAGVYKNSGWNQKTKEIESFPGKKWEGFVGVFRWKGYELVLYKENCLNFLYVETDPVKPTPKAEIKDDDLPYDPPKEEKKDNRIEVGGKLVHGGNDGFKYTDEQWQNFIFAKNPPRGCGGYNSSCGSGGYNYRNFIFAKNPPRGKCGR